MLDSKEEKINAQIRNATAKLNQVYILVVVLVTFICLHFWMRSMTSTAEYELQQQIYSAPVFVTQSSSRKGNDERVLQLISSIQEFYPERKILVYFSTGSSDANDDTVQHNTKPAIRVQDLENVKLINMETACKQVLQDGGYTDTLMSSCTSSKHVWWPIILKHALLTHEAAIFIHPQYKVNQRLSIMEAELAQSGHFFMKENYESKDWTCSTAVQGYAKGSAAFEKVLNYNFRELMARPFDGEYSSYFISEDKQHEYYMVGKWLRSKGNTEFKCKIFLDIPITTPHFGKKEDGRLVKHSQETPSSQLHFQLSKEKLQQVFNARSLAPPSYNNKKLSNILNKYAQAKRFGITVYLTQSLSKVVPPTATNMQDIVKAISNHHFFKRFLPQLKKSIPSNDKFFYIVYVSMSVDDFDKYGKHFEQLFERMVPIKRVPLALQIIPISDIMGKSAVYTYNYMMKFAISRDVCDYIVICTDRHLIMTTGWGHRLDSILESGKKKKHLGALQSSSDTSNAFLCVNALHVRLFGGKIFPLVFNQLTHVSSLELNDEQVRARVDIAEVPVYTEWIKGIYDPFHSYHKTTEIVVDGTDVSTVVLSKEFDMVKDITGTQASLQKILKDYHVEEGVSKVKKYIA